MRWLLDDPDGCQVHCTGFGVNMLAGTYEFGNAHTDGANRRGWFVGHFIDPDDIRTFKDVEIKWGIHPAGEDSVVVPLRWPSLQ